MCGLKTLFLSCFSTMMNCEINDTEFGLITLRSSRKARRIIFKAKEGRINIVFPATGYYTPYRLASLIEEYRETLRKLQQRSLSSVNLSALYDGKVIEIPEGKIVVQSSSAVGKGRVRAVEDQSGLLYILYSSHDDVASPALSHGIGLFIMRQLMIRYAHILRTMVQEEIDRRKLSVQDIRIGRGRRVLGHCTRSGVITISAYTLFYPIHLRQYIICHELAHLTHFNHSKAFHELCNNYCNGMEQQWRKEVRKFTFPIP